MTLERMGATVLINRQMTRLQGRVMELGVGDDPYRSLFDDPPISIDIDFANRPTVVADAHRLPFKVGAFDSVLASQVFEHLHSPWEAVAELHRVTKGGAGAIVVAVPFLFPLHQEPHDYFRYTAHGLKRIFGQYFAIDLIIPYGGRTAVVCDMLFTPTRSSTLIRRGIRKLRKVLLGVDRGRHRSILGRLIVRCPPGQHPLGYILVCRRAEQARERPRVG